VQLTKIIVWENSRKEIERRVKMMNNSIFEKAKKDYFKKLKQYVPVVARVHGSNHPEFHEVHKLFDIIIEKTNEAGTKKPELSEEFSKLREITHNYTVPEDACESYEAVYEMLYKIDQAYQA